MNSFPLRVFAIDREIFVGDAKSLIVPSKTGGLQILPEHAPLISLLKEGDLIIEKTDGGEEKYPIAGGTLQVSDREVLVLVSF